MIKVSLDLCWIIFQFSDTIYFVHIKVQPVSLMLVLNLSPFTASCKDRFHTVLKYNKFPALALR